MQNFKRVPISLIKSSLRYEHKTGLIYWRGLEDRPKFIQKRNAYKETAKGLDSNGYKRIRINGVRLFAHRVAWALIYGKWPDGVIDHINGDKTDNRKSNLRDCSSSDNSKNQRIHALNKSGVTGVSWHKNRRKWRACIVSKGKHTDIGFYSDIFEAICARKSFENKLGFSRMHGLKR